MKPVMQVEFWKQRSKSGYLTRIYTIDVDKEEKDVSYSFSDLTPIE